jgi:hypothetical protein
MAIAERKILYPLVAPTTPVEKIREAVRIVAAEVLKKTESDGERPAESRAERTGGRGPAKRHNH